jgi:hypothetical protein
MQKVNVSDLSKLPLKRFISQKAYSFLKKVSTTDLIVNKRLTQYRAANNLK